MIKKIAKNEIRQKRHQRLRYDLSGTAERPRLNVFRSLKTIYAQIVDDAACEGRGKTLVSASGLEKEIKAKTAGMRKVDASKVVGKTVAERALAKGITEVVFDRGGYLYTGRVASLADGAREAGLKF